MHTGWIIKNGNECINPLQTPYIQAEAKKSGENVSLEYKSTNSNTTIEWIFLLFSLVIVSTIICKVC
jgi:hypothetical protein